MKLDQWGAAYDPELAKIDIDIRLRARRRTHITRPSVQPLIFEKIQNKEKTPFPK